MWLNIGVDHYCSVNKHGSYELYDYSPYGDINSVSYTTTLGGTLAFNNSGAGINYNFSRTVTYSTSDRYVKNKFNVSENLVSIHFAYECFTMKNKTWDGILKGVIVAGVPGILYGIFGSTGVKHKDTYETFLQEMVEHSIFIVQVPKDSESLNLELQCQSNQLYIDYDYINSHNFECVPFSKTITISNL